MRRWFIIFIWLLLAASAFAHVPQRVPFASPAGVFSYGYAVGPSGSPAALIRSLSLPNLASITNHFDSRGRLDFTALLNRSGHVLDGYTYAHDALGLRTNLTRDFGLGGSQVAIGYDAIGELTSWSAQEAGAPSSSRPR